MQWYHFAENLEELAALYDDIPLLHRVELMQVRFLEGGARIGLRIELPRFPDKPPRKWIVNQDNTVQLQLDFLGVEEGQMVGWSTTNVVDVHIETNAQEQVTLRVTSPSCRIQARARSFRISNIIAYRVRP